VRDFVATLYIVNSLYICSQSTDSFGITKNLISDVEWSLSYKTKTTYFFKTKTTFSRPRPLCLKTIKFFTQDHWRSQKFWLGKAQIGKNFMTLFWWRFSVT